MTSSTTPTTSEPTVQTNYSPEAGLEGQVALITGAGAGIGAVVAQTLAQQGLTILASDLDLQAAQRTADALGAQGHRAFALGLDVGSPASIQQAFAEIAKRWERCDVLVNCAGIAKTFSFLEFPLENWQRTLDVNVTGTLLCAQHAARLMVQRRWGRIINIASVAGLRAVGEGRTAYGTSKAAVIGLTRQMAVELAAHGITANAVCPGPVDTPMTQVLHSPAFRRQYTAAIPMGRYGSTAEIAAVVAFLASQAAAYITGVAMPVDGGFMAAGARPLE
jgi:NAD(P)-dependent dehydrogenase (short-subunit alcohol dehydrogenase family)